MDAIYTARNVSYICLLFSMAAGVALFVVMDRRNYRQVALLTEKVHERTGEEDAGQIMDDYSYIGKRIEDMLEDRKKSDAMIENQKVVIQRLFLNNLLSTEQRSAEKIYGQMQSSGIEGGDGEYCVAVLRREQEWNG